VRDHIVLVDRNEGGCLVGEKRCVQASNGL
jgi:hypothetical protein